MSTANLSNNGPWLILQDGRMGTDGQARGLAGVMGIQQRLWPYRLRWWQRLLPPLWCRKFLAKTLRESFKQPPAGVIGAGRRAAYLLLAAQEAWPGITTIQIQNPKIDPANFTHVVTPQHDGLAGANVITTLGGLHNVNENKLAEAKAKWEAILSKFNSPRVAVLIGGNNKYAKLDQAWTDDLIAKLKSLQTSGHALWITPSRRTPPAVINALRNALAPQNVFIWDGNGDNPYLGFLALADFILVTSDSVSMISESLYTDKPLALLRTPGVSRKFARFYEALIANGYTDWFDGSWKINNRPTLRETERAARLLLQ